MKLCIFKIAIAQIYATIQAFAAPEFLTQKETASAANIRCNFKTVADSNWNQCLCKETTNELEISIHCNRVSWTSIPGLPVHDDSSKTELRHAIVSISVTDSNLSSLAQDTFKNQGIKVIELTNNHINNINVNAFRNLEDKLYELKLTHNELSSIPTWSLTYLHQLRYLHLQNNIISSIKSKCFDETQLQNLRYLYLDNNQIRFLPEESLSNLRLHVLTVSNNRIEEIEKNALPSTLLFLDLKNNALQQIPYLALGGLRTLQALDLEGNNITKVLGSADAEFDSFINLLLKNNRIEELGNGAFTSFRKLTRLDLSYNQISKISGGALSSVRELKHLDLSNNNIVHIPHRAFESIGKSMQTLNLEENYLHTLPSALQHLRSLETLNLNNNKLTLLDSKTLINMKPALTELLLAFNRLGRVPTEALDGMKKLHSLDLSKNRIRIINRISFGTFEGARSTLNRLNLAGNLIEEITDVASFLYMSSLAHLDLSHNQIRNLGDNVLSRLENLETLQLQGNAIKTFPTAALNGLTRLRYLSLDENPIDLLPEAALANLKGLQHLSVTRTLLAVIGPDTFHETSTRNLNALNLAFNRVENISSQAFQNVDQLEQLFLHNNKLERIAAATFSNMKNLRHLSLANNRIKEIQHNALEDLPSLEQLSLANNHIVTIPKKTFVNLNSLRYLDFSKNELRFFDFSFLRQPTVIVERLDLSRNKLSTIDLTEAKRTLTHLNLAGNQFLAIGKNIIHDLPLLQTLDLSDNGIFEISNNAFTESPKLHRLNLSHNHLRYVRRLTFAKQELIEILDLRDNDIRDIEADAFGENNIHLLDVSKNNLQEIPCRALNSIRNSLVELCLASNHIKALDETDFRGMSNLSTLILAYNQIEVIEESAFSALPNLLKLDLSHNPVITWNPQAFKELGHAIKFVDLANTGLFSLPRITNAHLRHLNISRNKIIELQAKEMSHYKKLETLDISDNNIGNIDAKLIESLDGLKSLNICGNPIKILTGKQFKHLHRVEQLSICKMPLLRSLPAPREFRYLRSLQALQMYKMPQLSDYNLPQILQNLPPLQKLDIEIKESVLSTQFYKADVRLLRSLTISGKNLRQLDTGAFVHLSGFKFDLTIRDTSINEFPTTIFNTLTSVNLLSLSLINNRIRIFQPFKNTKMPIINQHGTTLLQLELQGNPLPCGCQLKWLSEWIEYTRTSLALKASHTDDFQCVEESNDDRGRVVNYTESLSIHCENGVQKCSNATPMLLVLLLFKMILNCEIS